MKYDTQQNIAPDAILSNIRIIRTEEDNSLSIEFGLLLNLPSPRDYYLPTSYCRVQQINNNQIISDTIHNFTEGNEISGYLVSNLTNTPIQLQSGITGIRISSRIYLDNNTSFTFNNRNIPMGTSFINTYFNNIED